MCSVRLASVESCLARIIDALSKREQQASPSHAPWHPWRARPGHDRARSRPQGMSIEAYLSRLGH